MACTRGLSFFVFITLRELYIINKANKCPAATTRPFIQAIHDVVNFEEVETEENEPP